MFSATRGPQRLLPGIAFLLTACAAPTYGTEGRSAVQPVEVEVTNHNWMDVTIYAEQDGSRVRLGSVRTTRSERFTLPPYMSARSGTFVLQVQPIGSTEVFRSAGVMASPGSRIVFRVENQLSQSSESVVPIR